MASYAPNSPREENKRFSHCSLESIKRAMRTFEKVKTWSYNLQKIHVKIIRNPSQDPKRQCLITKEKLMEDPKWGPPKVRSHLISFKFRNIFLSAKE